MIDKEEARALIRSLWHKQDEPVAIGCQGCPDRPHCGGIKVAASIFSCMDHWVFRPIVTADSGRS